MLEAFREEEIVKKVGGRFKLSSLIQKRMVSLNRGARPLVETGTSDLMQIVVAEIMHDKIYLDMSGNVRAVADDSDAVDATDDGPTLDDVI